MKYFLFSNFIIFLNLINNVNNWCKQSQLKTNIEIKVMDISPGGRYLAVGHSDNNVRIYHTRNYLQMTKVSFNVTITAVRFSPDGSYLAIGLDDKRIHTIYAYQTFSTAKSLNSSLNSIVGLDWTSDSNQIVFCGANGMGAGNGKLGYFNLTTNGSSNNWNEYLTNLVSSGNPVDCRVSNFNNRIAVSISSKILIYDSLLNYITDVDSPSNVYYKIAMYYLSYQFFYIDNNGDVFTHVDSSLNEVGISGTNDLLYALDVQKFARYSAVGGRSKTLYIFNSSFFKVVQWNASNQIKAIVFTKFAQNNKLFVGDLSGEILVLSLNCSYNCPIQYYYSGSTCTLCSLSLSQCLTCINGTVCDTCIQGFYVDPNLYTCKNCSKLGCMTCINSGLCTQCNQGFYLSSGTCNRCDKNNQGCLICNSSSYCFVCNNDYLLNVSNNKCDRCNLAIPNCLKCSNTSQCIQCSFGFYRSSNGSCYQCNSRCLACHNSANNCSQCIKGYYNNGYTCTPCQQNCLSCNNSNFCFQCKNSMYEKSDGTCVDCSFPCLACQNSTKCYYCAQGYYLSSGICYNCTVNNCATCNSSSYCASCLAGFYLLANNSCRSCPQQYPYCQYCSQSSCQSCQPGYFFNSSSLCQHCSDRIFKCEKCTSLSQCLSCLQGFYLTGLTGNSSCKSCAIGCQTCFDSTDCKKCYQNYYLDINSKCIMCENNCIQCLNITYCQVCQSGYFVDSANTCKLCNSNISFCFECYNGTDCINCQVGYYLDTTTKKCVVCPNNCTTCSSVSKCLTCYVGYYLTTGATPSCQICPLECTQCTSLLVCTSCKVGFWLQTSSKTCKNCTLLNRYCRSCSQITCFSCVKGYYLHNTISPPNNQCVSCLSKIEGCLTCNASNYCFECDYGYYLSNTQKCVSCTSIQGCQSCFDSLNCLKCIQGYYLNSTYKCELCDNGCKTCDQYGNCYSCRLGFYLSGYLCERCDAYNPGCTLCTNMTQCTQCSNGYYLVSGVNSTCQFCRLQMGGCLYCNSSSICTKCQTGFYLNTTINLCQMCSKNIQGCQICKSSSFCVDCQTGFYLTIGGAGSHCSMCISALQGCLQCINLNTCKICKTGFYLNLTTNKCLTCSSKNNGCEACNSFSLNTIICNKCSSGFYLNSNTSLCSPCNNEGCQICNQSDSNICLACDLLYYKNSTNCVKCSYAIQGCSECLTSSLCQYCDIGYYLLANYTCELCQNTIQGCQKCILINSTLQCTECKSSYFLNLTSLSSGSCITCFQAMQGCLYCENMSSCISCGNGYFKNQSTQLCQSCTSLPGCLLCQNQTKCQYCMSGYYMDYGLYMCKKCSIAIPFCVVCLVPTKCLSCESGYQSNGNRCDVATVTQKQKIKEFKLITQYVSPFTLSHILLISSNMTIKNDYNLSISSFGLYLTDYNSLADSNITQRKIIQTKLVIQNIQWIASNKLQFFTDNPTNITQQGIGGDNMFAISSRRRVLSQNNSFKSLDNFKVSLEINHKAVNSIFPQFYQTGDFVIDYSLDQPQFYISYLKNNGNSNSTYFSIFGYIICTLILITFIYKISKVKTLEHIDNHSSGQLLSHIFAIKTIGMTIYPISYQFYCFCYGFMIFDFPWLNQYFGKNLAQRSDYIPTQFIMYYVNLNIASTFFMATCVFCLLILGRLTIDKRDKLKRAKYSQIVYSTFLFGFIYSGSLSIQGSFYNPISQHSLNSFFYLLGILLYIGFFIQILHSILINKQNFYKARIFCKASILSIGYINAVIVVPICAILDCCLLYLQYKLIQLPRYKGKEDKGSGFMDVTKLKCWLISHISLNLSLLIIFLFPKATFSLLFCMAIICLVVFLQIFLTCKPYCNPICFTKKPDQRSVKKQILQKRLNKSTVQKTKLQNLQDIRNESVQTLINDNNNRSTEKNNIWNLDEFVSDVIELKRGKKQSSKNNQNKQGSQIQQKNGQQNNSQTKSINYYNQIFIQTQKSSKKGNLNPFLQTFNYEPGNIQFDSNMVTPIQTLQQIQGINYTQYQSDGYLNQNKIHQNSYEQQFQNIQKDGYNFIKNNNINQIKQQNSNPNNLKRYIKINHKK